MQASKQPVTGRFLWALGLILGTGAFLLRPQLFAAQAPTDDSGQESSSHQPPRPKPRQVLQEAKPPIQDCYGDPLPVGAVARMGTVRFLHGGTIHGLGISADGKIIASGNGYATAVWQAATGKELRRFACDRGVLSPDGKTVLVADRSSRMILLKDVATGRIVRALEGRHLVSELTLSADGRLLAANILANDGQQGQVDAMQLWDVATGKKLRPVAGWMDDVFFSGWAWAMAFSPDGGTLIVLRIGSSGGIGLCDVATGKLRRVWRNQGMDVCFMHFALSPDSKTAAVVVNSTAVFLLDLVAGKILCGLTGNPARIDALAFSPDGHLLAGTGCSNDGQNALVHLWEVKTRKLLRQFPGRATYPYCLAFFPDNQTLATAGEDGILRRWDAATGKEYLPAATDRDKLSAAAFSADGKTLATYGRRGATWEVATGKKLTEFQAPKGDIASVTLSPHGRTFVSHTWQGPFSICETGTGKELHRIEALPSEIRCLTFSPDGGRLGTFHRRDKSFRIWDVAVGKEVRHWSGEDRANALPAAGPKLPAGGPTPISPRERLEAVTAIDFSPDGKTLASVSEDGTLRLWEVATGKERSRFGGGSLGSPLVRFSPDGRVLATLHGGSTSVNFVYLWDVATGKHIRQFKGRGMHPPCFAFSPDGTVIATSTGSGWDGARAIMDDAISIYDLFTGDKVACLEGHRDRVSWLAFSSNGSTLASASDDTTALIWEVRPSIREGKAAPIRLAPKELEAGWSDLGGSDATKAYKAIWALAQAGNHTVQFLQARLRPESGDPDIARLLRDLDNNNFAVRRQATEELAGLGDLAQPALLQALGTRLSPEARKRVELLLERSTGPITSPERLRAIRVVQVLELIATKEACQLLDVLKCGRPGNRPDGGSQGCFEASSQACQP